MINAIVLLTLGMPSLTSTKADDPKVASMSMIASDMPMSPTRLTTNAFFVMVVAAAEVVVGLAIIVTIFRTRRSASVDDANLLKF